MQSGKSRCSVEKKKNRKIERNPHLLPIHDFVTQYSSRPRLSHFFFTFRAHVCAFINCTYYRAPRSSYNEDGGSQALCTRWLFKRASQRARTRTIMFFVSFRKKRNASARARTHTRACTYIYVYDNFGANRSHVSDAVRGTVSPRKSPRALKGAFLSNDFFLWEGCANIGDFARIIASFVYLIWVIFHFMLLLFSRRAV